MSKADSRGRGHSEQILVYNFLMMLQDKFRSRLSNTSTVGKLKRNPEFAPHHSETAEQQRKEVKILKIARKKR